MERLRKLHSKPGVRVEPANADMRRLLKHPRAGGFRSEGSMEWPDDTFTGRRLRDGDIKLVTAAKPTTQPTHPKPPQSSKEPAHPSTESIEQKDATHKGEGGDV
jgi:hypothetical protein